MRLLTLGFRMALAVTILMVLCTFGIVAVMLGMSGARAVRLVLPTWARLNLLACSLKVEIVHGAEHLTAHRPCIFIANHQGLLDAFVLPTLLDAPMFYPVKKELVWIPFMGWFAYVTKQPLIDRNDHFKAMQAMDQAGDYLKSGLCTLLFPEGTRSRDGRLGEFKKGAFRLSMDTGLPLVPIVLVDCSDHLPMGTLALVPGTVHVAVGDPIDTTGWTRRTVDQKILEVRDYFLKTIAAERAKLGLPPSDPEAVAADA